MRESTTRVQAVKVRRGLYELRGVTHTQPAYPGQPACGGQVYAQRFRGVPDPWGWECFCRECLDCDPNGWPTLRDCLREAPRYWEGES